MKKKQDVVDWMKAQKVSPAEKKRLDEIKQGGRGVPVYIPELVGEKTRAFLEGLEEDKGLNA
jgi:hypothetical protein